tara:strand:+ start:70 stop:285 length:216 start_codon:yes stop_codon:yes gene_type:complete
MLTNEQVNQRMSDKLEAKLFYAYKNLEEIELMLEGVIPSKMDEDALMSMQMTSLNNIQVYTRMFDLVEMSY